MEVYNLGAEPFAFVAGPAVDVWTRGGIEGVVYRAVVGGPAPGGFVRAVFPRELACGAPEEGEVEGRFWEGVQEAAAAVLGECFGSFGEICGTVFWGGRDVGY